MICVHDAHGAPVIGALVYVEWSDTAVPELPLQTDARGEVKLWLPPGRYRLAASTTDGRRGAAEVEVRGDESTLGSIGVR